MSAEKGRNMLSNPVHVTKTFLPPFKSYVDKIKPIWDSCQLTNNGPMVKELEAQLETFLGLEPGQLVLVSNGTLALQLPLRAFELQGAEIITTPFSYVATTSSILWEGARPIFADISSSSLCIDPVQVEKKITPTTKAILATHVFGRPCDHKALEALAVRYGLKLVYDGAHAFGVRKNGESILRWGDVSTLSLHATKLFHSAEGGAIISKDRGLIEKLKLLRAFGHKGDEHFCMGINAKMSELHAAMGLCVLSCIDDVFEYRKTLAQKYKIGIQNLHKVQTLPMAEVDEENVAYFPVVFSSESHLLKSLAVLEDKNIFLRRYFYPSLNKLPYIDEVSLPFSDDLAVRIACLPMGRDALNPEFQNTLFETLKDLEKEF